MARWEFKLPDIGEGVTEGEIVGWCEGISVGATIQADAPLVDVLTDKATVTITSPRGGVIVELGGKVGDIIQVGANLVVLDLADGDAPPPPQAHSHHDAPSRPAPRPQAPAPHPASPSREDGPAATAVGDIKETLPGMGGARPTPAPALPPTTTLTSTPSTGPSERPLATPATRKLARDLSVDLHQVTPTGPNGRITDEDVKRAAAVALAPAPPPTSEPPASFSRFPLQREPIRVVAPTPAQAALEEREPLRGVRKKIFEQMARSKQTAAHFTFVEECDVTALKELRTRLRPIAEKQGVKLTFLPFILKAVVAALKRHPELNSAFDESTGEIVRRKYYNLGIASSTDAGLMVPVIKDCDRRSLLDLAREIQRLGEATKSGKVRVEDLQGSTFTVTSLGQQGGLFATPILNTPEVGILGVHQMKRKPVVRGDQIVIGEVMLLSLSFDHRLIDGHVGAAFAYEVIRFLEDPDQLLLEA
ncbi:MAG: dihydrolipoamide acetyltransferase family protein [Myxococcales bacterium]|nr:2-oxo acid dehydrogenase subunit E2 [Polyangiaceae bacterium]MDW8247782.1 dihydrolipoamide acetyltransferase family protein [Myxococcales bacterium]